MLYDRDRAALLEGDRTVRVEPLVAVREVAEFVQLREVVPKALVIGDASKESMDCIQRACSRAVVVPAEQRVVRDDREVDRLRAVREFDGQDRLVVRLAGRVLRDASEVEGTDSRILNPLPLGLKVLGEEPDLLEL